jgi:hypothetical protein
MLDSVVATAVILPHIFISEQYWIKTANKRFDAHLRKLAKAKKASP